MTATYTSGISTTEVRLFSNVSTTEVPNTTLIELMKYAAIQLNHDIGILCEDWAVGQIDTEKLNTINNSNKTFYIPEYPLGDYNDDGEITGADVYVYSISSTGTRTEYTVSSIDNAKIGKFTLATALPTNESCYFTWRYVPIDQTTPDPLIKRALINLTNAYMQTRISPTDVQGWRVGKISISRQTPAFQKFYDNYKECKNQILSKIVMRADHPGFGSKFSYI